jgi:DNA (cytosine-5)-methyltransferase 1
MNLKFGSVASGIEAASQAFRPLGWEASWFSEIDPFASRYLEHHHPNVWNVGDMTKLPGLIASGQVEAPDVLCGGTPCQAFSVAGLRKSLGDARGNLSLTFCEIANAIDTKRAEQGKPPAIIFFENVPGALNVHDNFFGCFLGALAGEDVPLEPAGGKWSNAGCVFGPERAVAWRVLDAQHFGVAQRRRRLYVVACPLERAHPTQILFEFEGERRDSAPSRPEGEEATASLAASSGGVDENDAAGNLLQPYTVANCLTRRMHKGINTTLDEGQTPILAFVKGTNPHSKEEAPTFRETETAACLNGWDERHNPPKHLVANEVVGVRRLLPVECERLMGFPDNYTDIPGASDTARYKALGNSWPVPVVAWIGKRIQGALR